MSTRRERKAAREQARAWVASRRRRWYRSFVRRRDAALAPVRSLRKRGLPLWLGGWGPFGLALVDQRIVVRHPRDLAIVLCHLDFCSDTGIALLRRAGVVDERLDAEEARRRAFAHAFDWFQRVSA